MLDFELLSLLNEKYDPVEHLIIAFSKFVKTAIFFNLSKSF